MGQAKAVINLKEGVIQLEGPVEFVRQYLDMYRSAIGGVEERPKTVAVVAKKEVAARGRRRRAKRLSCVRAIRKEINGGFFSELRSAKEVAQQLAERGVACGPESVRISLRKLTGDGLLDRTKEGRSSRYQRKG